MENFLDQLNQIALQLTEWVWGIPLIVLLLAVGILLSVRMHFLQLRQLPRALKFMFQNEEGGNGEVSSFGALCTALSATIGTGNIVGVATAISLGGPGRTVLDVGSGVFWHGHKVCGGSAGGQVPQCGFQRSCVGWGVLLY